MRRREFSVWHRDGLAARCMSAEYDERQAARIAVLWHAGCPEEEQDYLAVLQKAFSGSDKVRCRYSFMIRSRASL